MNLALFDFDGTITWGDTWTPFMRFAVRPHRIAAAYLILMPAYAGYKLGRTPAGKVREVAARVGFSGETASSIRALGREYAATALPRMIRPAALERIGWHKSQGDDIVVVSASLDAYLDPWCDGQRLRYICTTLEERGGTLTGRCIDGDCCGAEKVRRIRARYDLARYDVIYAYGDTPDDRPMLDLAHRTFYKEWGETREINSEIRRAR